MTDTNSELLRYEVWHFSGPYGGRVFTDGRYELYDRHTTGEDPQWEAFEPFTPEQTTALATAVDALIQSLSPEDIERPTTVSPDSATATFVLRDKEYTITSYPFAAPVQFTELVELITTLRKPNSTTE